MPFFILYLFKLSVSLTVVFLFYQFILRRLTFYNWNRWYLLGYTFLSFIIPFIDITPALQENELNNTSMIQWVPVLHKQSTGDTTFSFWNILSLVVVAGMLIMLTRLLVQLFSFRRMMKKAKLISGDTINLYQVNEPIIPFSFGNAVFFNVNLHTTEELEKIIRHEFVHVKQRHSIDILFSEILCLLNWYNPFGWMIRTAIRQNLEFVADNQVLENGINKKQYQYLLLKVIGNNQFSIAQKFNFSSLKKRIAMMNKNKSAKLHLLRFLFVLPVLAVILVSFRKEISDTLTGKQKQLSPIPAAVIDTVPEVTRPNSKGYIINVKDMKGECLLVIKDKTGKEVKRVLLTKWNEDKEQFEKIYGEIPPPPPPPFPAPPKGSSLNDFMKRNPSVKEVGWVFNNDNSVVIMQINKKDGTSEKYNLENDQERENAEEKYGRLPLIPPPAPPVPADEVDPAPPAPPAPAKLPKHVSTINISNENATVILKDGTKEKYDLSIPAQKKSFESKYGKLPAPPLPPPVPDKVDKIEILGVETTSDNVIYILDGREVKAYEVTMLQPEKILTVDVLKGESATSVYGEKAKNGAIIVTTKQTNTKGAANPLYIIDDVISTKEASDKLKPAEILSVNVLGAENAKVLYGEKGKNGAVIIKTKKITPAKPVSVLPQIFPGNAVKAEKDNC